MSQQENEEAECPFSGNAGDLVNVKFFRGRRDDVIGASEIKEQLRSADMQLRQKAAHVSQTAPVSLHPTIDVHEFVASL